MEAEGMNLSVSVTLVFGCVLFYASMLLYLNLRRWSGDEASGSRDRRRGAA